jgi:hypothetical protein
MDKCWGVGASAFFFGPDGASIRYENGKYVMSMLLDPMPAKLRDGVALSGGNGTQAAAYYPETGLGTTAYKWYGSWLAGTVPAGAPCSTDNLLPGADVPRIIEAYNTKRRCIAAE